MKNVSIIMMSAAVMLFGTSVKAQNIKSSLVPRLATNALKARYPMAKQVTWEKENANFEANWGGKSGEDMSVVFTPSGTFVEQAKAITVESLPTAASGYIKAHYPGKKVSEAVEVTDGAGKITYEAEISGKQVLFDNKGAFIKASKEND